MPDEAKELWKYAPVVLVLIVVIWAGAKGYWYWGGNARRVIEDIKRDRDHWRELALTLAAELREHEPKAKEAQDGSKKIELP